MAEEFSYRPKDVFDPKSPSSRSNLVDFNIRLQGIMIIDKDLLHCVAEEIHHTSLPYETAQDQELCRSYIRRAMRKTWGKLNSGTPPHFSQNLTH
jgi:hypothetical protein